MSNDSQTQKRKEVDLWKVRKDVGMFLSHFISDIYSESYFCLNLNPCELFSKEKKIIALLMRNFLVL